MPHGKYVAFEGYDTIHDCKKPVQKKRSEKPTPAGSGTSVPFAEFELPTDKALPDTAKSGSRKRSTIGRPTRTQSTPSQVEHETVTSSGIRHWEGWGCLFWLAAAAGALFLLDWLGG